MHFLLLLLTQALCVCTSPTPKLPLPQDLVYQFPLGTWIENLWVRPSGDLLLTRFEPSAALYSISPSSPRPEADLVAVFPTTSLAGITETVPGVYAVVAGNLTFHPPTPVPGTFAIYLVSLLCNPPKVTKAADLSKALFPNGLLTLPLHPHVILIADSGHGVVWRLDTQSGHLDIAIDDPEMRAPPTSTLQIGINGIRIVGPWLYFTNSATQKLFRVRITSTGSMLPGAKVELVAELGVLADDFDVDEYGTIWVAGNANNVLLAVRPDGRVTTVDGGIGSLAVAGATAAKFGKGKDGRKTLYVTTDGALFAPVNGTATEGGKVVAVDTRRFL